ncbi:hypothetical protein [Cerasicoccus frondis]|uniref:hypothetical protein n=1 Tax=Cerasicoccus frondis TaxID=490090 RepID=UPI002852B16F|nr:hypothetical protein [Cerasicoccus frondis]
MDWVQDPNAEHLAWLVSGLDNYVGLSPDITIDLDSQLQPVDPGLALLAGPRTVGANNAEDVIVAPKVYLGTAADAGNAYAYWIADEATKAPMNLVDERYLSATGVGDDELVDFQSRLDLMAPEKVGLQAFEEWSAYPLTDLSVAEKRWRISEFPDAQLIADSSDMQQWNQFLQANYHDFSVGSMGLQTDVRNGGLKKDLSLLFEMDDEQFALTPYGGTPSGRSDDPPTDGDSYIDAYTETQVSYLFKKEATVETPDTAYLRGPTWHFLRSYYRLYKDIDNAEGDPQIAARAYRPNTIDFNAVNGAGADGRFSGYVNVMNGRDNGKPLAGNNFVNTRVKPPDWASEVDVPRLTAHEVAPVAVRIYLIFSFARVSLDDVLRIHRDENGVPTSSGSNNWSLESTGSGDIAAVMIQPVAVVWNPYNVKISFNAYKVVLDKPFLAFDISWPEELNSTTASRGYLATLGMMLGASIQNHNADGSLRNDDFSYFEFMIGDPPDGNNPIVLEPGEQRIFSASDKMHLGDVITQGEALFLEEGWHTDGGLLLYRKPDTAKRYTYQGQAAEIDNIPYEFPHSTNAAGNYPITINDVFWVADNGNRLYNKKLIRLNSTKKGTGLADYLLTDIASIAEGGDRESDDYELRSIGASYSHPSDIQDAFDSGIRGLEITPADIHFSNGVYPFMALEISLNPANSVQGSPMEMLGNTNPFGILGSAFQGGGKTADRYQLYVKPLSGTYHEIKPEITLNGAKENTYFGYSYSVSDGSSKTVLQETPTTPLWSLGSMQHANISRSAYLPRNAIGNAQASPYFATDDDDLQEAVGDWQLKPSLYDISYFSNEALFDSFYFSSLAPYTDEADVAERLQNELEAYQTNDDEFQLPNRRFTLTGLEDEPADIVTELLTDDAYRKTAAYWAPEGSFNVNSTSVTAWKAFLSAHLGRQFDYFDGNSINTATASNVLYSRYALPNSGVASAAITEDDWYAPIELNETQIDALANAMVDEVKARGPFLSLADFVNRRPLSPDANQQRSGALASAIDAANLNGSIEDHGIDAYEGFDVSSDFLDENTLDNTAAGIPGWLTQADVLTPLAPYLSARSDTFIIRSYGEVSDPLTGDVNAKAWCEVKVQRVSDYVNAAQNEPWDDIDNLTSENQSFGRRFVVTGFRWLTENDI